MGQRESDTRAVKFEDVEVPAANRLGEEGYGFTIAMKASISRARGGIGRSRTRSSTFEHVVIIRNASQW